MRTIALALALALGGCLAPTTVPEAPDAPSDVRLPVAVVETDAGAFAMVLYEDAAPKTVANFRRLAAADFYDGVVFHRVIDGFVIQTGDPTGSGQGGSLETVPAEPGVHFAAGAVGMARDEDPDSATSQWFVCEYPQPHLHDPPEGSTYGAFTAWAQVVEGMEVVKAIAAASTYASTVPQAPRGVLPDRPVDEVRILDVAFEERAFPADVAETLPLRTTGRYVTEEHRTALEMPATLAAGRPATLAWYTVPSSEGAAPLRDAVVAARGPDGATRALFAARDAADPFVLRTAATFDVAGTWNLTLAAGGRTYAAFDVEVEGRP